MNQYIIGCLLVLCVGLFLEGYRMIQDHLDRAFLTKQVIQELVDESVVISRLLATDPMEANRLVGEALSKWSILERIVPIHTQRHQKIQAVLLAQREEIWQQAQAAE
jgi:hypothetical protein